MKQRFLANYSHDLLVGNEETALCLEQLNKDTCKPKSKTTTGRRKRQQQRLLTNDENNNNGHKERRRRRRRRKNKFGSSENENEDDEEDLMEEDESSSSSSHFGDDNNNQHDDDDNECESDDSSSWETTNGLLFVDYSIIQFARVISILRTLYEPHVADEEALDEHLAAVPTKSTNFSTEITSSKPIIKVSRKLFSKIFKQQKS